MINSSTTIYSNNTLVTPDKKVKNGGKIILLKLITSSVSTIYSVIIGTVNNQFIYLENTGEVTVNLNENENNNIDLQIKGAGTIIITKLAIKNKLHGAAIINNLTMRLKA